MSTEAGKLAGAVDVWLRQELQDSHTGRNGYLDDNHAFRMGTPLPPSDSRNVDAQKVSSHHARFNLALSLRSDPAAQDDFFLAKITHHALMFVSGGFRNYCHFRADDQADYEALRFGRIDETGGATTEDIEWAAEIALLDVRSSSVSEARQRFIERGQIANDRILRRQMAVYEWLADHRYAQGSLGENTLPVRVSRERQRLGLGVALSHMVLVALERDGDLAQIPMLDARSITDVSATPSYPLRRSDGVLG